uniref:Uncharacterized protein n=1 Tax=Anguilla anguilla TaxID=7936 RepID=A0A0E9VJZ3_ANGAN
MGHDLSRFDSRRNLCHLGP